MVNLTKISKVVLVAGALAFASFYSNPSYAIWDAPDDYYSSGSGNTETGNTPPVNMPALTAPTTNLADMAGSIELPTTIESRDPLVKASKAAAEKDAAKEKLDQIEKQYQADLQDLNAQISKEGISKKEKKELQQKIADLKKQYQKDQSEAATAYNNALSEYQTNKTAATSNVSVNAKRSAYNAARQEYNNLAKCAEAPADCKDSNGNPITDADGNPLTTTTLNALLAEKKAAADAAYNDYRAEQNALTGKNADLQKDVQNAKNEVKDLEQKLEDAQNGCNYYKQMVRFPRPPKLIRKNTAAWSILIPVSLKLPKTSFPRRKTLPSRPVSAAVTNMKAKFMPHSVRLPAAVLTLTVILTEPIAVPQPMMSKTEISLIRLPVGQCSF